MVALWSVSTTRSKLESILASSSTFFSAVRSWVETLSWCFVQRGVGRVAFSWSLATLRSTTRSCSSCASSPGLRSAASISLRWKLHRSAMRSFSCSDRGNSSSSFSMLFQRAEQVGHFLALARPSPQIRPANATALRRKKAAAARAAHGYRPETARSRATARLLQAGFRETRATCPPPALRARSAARHLPPARPPAPTDPAARRPCGASKMAETRARSVSDRTMSADARPPKTSPSASTTMDLPLPVSPVSRLSPAWNLTRTRSTTA